MTRNPAHEIFANALERPRGERDEFVRERCGEDLALVAEVLELLSAAEEEISFVDRPLVSRPEGIAEFADDRTELPGVDIGPYRILHEIGSGGMGLVYEAEQEHPVHRRVALKIIKPGMDSREVGRRFEMERQTLFSLEHPGIARAYDAGTTKEGRPYFVMELVRGRPIASFCDEERLDLDARLELFVQVCRAVQYAHLRGVIHRDLKSSNVLVVDQDGTLSAKVIDFGIAKALSQDQDGTALTRKAQPIGTPEAMSPEQATGEAVDIRTDVYAAGALLYRLLSGRGLFSDETSRSSDWASLQRMILEDAPSPPSTVVQRAGGAPPGIDVRRLGQSRELDWIVQRALAKEPERRYQSMEELAADIERFLNHEAVLAGPESQRYRIAKFVRRNQLAVGAAATIAVLVLGGSLALAVQAARLRAALEIAESKRAQAEQVTTLIGSVLGGADPLREGRKDVTALELLERGEPKVRAALVDQPEVLAELLRIVADVRRNLGDLDGAAALYEELLDLETAADNPAGRARALTGLTLVRDDQARAEDADELSVRAVEVARAGVDPVALVDALQARGQVLRAAGSLDDAEQVMSEAVTLADAEPSVPENVRRGVRRLRAILWTRQGRSEEAAEEVARLLDEEIRDPSLTNTAPLLRSTLGALLIDLGRSEEALPHLEEVLRYEVDLLGNAHPQTLVTRANIALAAGNTGDLERARDMNLESLEALESTTPGPHGHKALLLNNLGLNQHGLGDLADAEASFRRALEIQRAVVGDDHPNLAFHLSNLARVLHETRRSAEAEADYRFALELRDRHLPVDHPARADTEIWLGALLVETGRAEQALQHLQRGVDIREAKMDPRGWQVAEARSWLGTGLIAMGRLDEGLPLVVDAYPTIREQRGDVWWRTAPALERVIAAHEAAGEDEAAAEARRWLTQRHPERIGG